MSHFTCLVILPNQEEYSESNLQKMLEPFNENKEVPSYEKECYCIGFEARRYGVEQADIALGKTIQHFRDEYHKMEDNVRPEWETFIAPLVEAREHFEKEHPLYKKPTADCEECGGSGVAMTTYNPKSKWDWYSVGGRWSNMLLTKDGKYVDIAKVKDIDFHTMKEKDKQRAIETWEQAKNVDGTERYFRYGIENGQEKEDYVLNSSLFHTFSVLSEDGVWHERGNMGWFGIVHGEEETSLQWAEQFYARFIESLHPETTIVVVDCHI